MNSYKAFYTREEPPTVKLNAFRCLPWDLHLCVTHYIFTYAGHHNNSHAKSYFNQTVISSWPGFDTLDHSTNAISLIWTSFFSFLRLEFHFVAPESARKKNSYGRTGGWPHRFWPDLEAPGTTPRTPKSLPVTARSSKRGPISGH